MTKKVKFFFIFISVYFFSFRALAHQDKADAQVKPSQFFDFVYEKAEIVTSGNPTKIVAKYNPYNTEEYVLIRAGVSDWGPNSFSKISQYALLRDNYPSCVGENLPFTNFNIQNNQKTLNDKFKILSKCLSLKIEDEGSLGILIPEEGTQSCKFKKVNENLVMSTIGDCFLKVKPNQVLSVSMVANTECSNREFIRENGISPTELMGLIEAYTYPTPYMGPFFEAIEKLDEKTFFLNINPGKELFSVSSIEIDSTENRKTIFRPTTLLFPQITISGMELSYSGRALFVDLSLLLSTNNAKGFCQSGLCSVQSNYDIPFVSEVFLYRINSNGKKEEINSQLIGDRIPNRWTGNLSSHFILKNVELIEGSNYALEFSFYDPYTGYQQLKRTTRSMLSLGRGSIGSIGTMGGMGSLGGFGGDGIGGLPTLGSGSLRGGLPRMSLSIKFPRLTQSIDDPTFPVEYKDVCNQSLTVCEKISSKEFARMISRFSVKGIKDNKVDFGNMLEISWKTNLWQDQDYKIDLLNKAPAIRCDD